MLNNVIRDCRNLIYVIGMGDRVSLLITIGFDGDLSWSPTYLFSSSVRFKVLVKLKVDQTDFMSRELLT